MRRATCHLHRGGLRRWSAFLETWLFKAKTTCEVTPSWSFNRFGGCWNKVKSDSIKSFDITHPKSHERQWSLPVFPSLLCGQHQPVGLHSQCCQNMGRSISSWWLNPPLKTKCSCEVAIIHPELCFYSTCTTRGNRKRTRVAWVGIYWHWEWKSLLFHCNQILK